MRFSLFPAHFVTFLSYRLPMAVCALAGLGSLLYLLSFCGFGVDFSDEGYYLNMLANPWAYDWSVSQFGFVYHPLYMMLKGNIAGLRAVNLLITFSLVVAVCSSLIQVLAGSQLRKGEVLSLSVALAAAGLMPFDTWLLTPNYNTLAFQGIIITSLGLIRGLALSWKSLSTFVLALGCYLTFLAKPTSAVAVVCSLCISMALCGIRRAQVLVAVLLWGICLFVLGSFVIDGSVVRHLERLKVGGDFAQLLEASYGFRNILRLDPLELTGDEITTTIVIAALILLSWMMFGARNILIRIGAGLMILFSILFGYFCDPDPSQSPITFGLFRGITFAGVLFGAILIASINFKRVSLNGRARATVSMLVFFFLMPYAYGFGTNVNYWRPMSKAAIFWVLDALVVLGGLSRYRKGGLNFLPACGATVALSLAFVQFGPRVPYRQPQPLWVNTEKVNFRSTGTTLRLTEDYASYVREAQSTAEKAGFMPGDRVLDLTGQSPGLIFAMQGENLGQAWNIGGYPGSLALATAALKRVSCAAIASSWLLLEPDCPASIQLDLPSALGSNLEVHYERVGEWKAADGAGGVPVRGRQQLYRPIAYHEILALCNEKRRGLEGFEQ